MEWIDLNDINIINLKDGGIWMVLIINVLNDC